MAEKRTGSSGPGESSASDKPANADKIRCDACPVMCYIADGKSGACDRYANSEGNLVRVDVHRVLYKPDAAPALSLIHI